MAGAASGRAKGQPKISKKRQSKGRKCKLKPARKQVTSSPADGNTATSPEFVNKSLNELLASPTPMPDSGDNSDNADNPVLFASYIAQIAPLSFQGRHRTQTQTSEVRWLHASVVTEWSPACLHKQFPGDLHRGSQRKPQMEDVHNLINIGPTNPVQILNQHDIF